MKRALIFGIGGLSGVYLGRELKQKGYEVIGFDLKDKEDKFAFDGYYQGDISNPKTVSSVINEVNPTHIFNLTDIGGVGQAWKKPRLTVDVNVNGVINILETCKSFLMQPKILLVGADDEYEPSDYALREDSPLKPSSPYGIAKMMQGQLAEIYVSKYDMQIYLCRQFSHAGIGQNEIFAIANWCKQASAIEKSGEKGTIYIGNIDIYRDFIDVRDLVDAYIRLIESDRRGEVFNIGSGKPVLMRDLLNKIISMMKTPVEIQVDGNMLRPVDKKYAYCDNTKLCRELGWEVKHDIMDTVVEMFKAYMK